MVERSSRSMSSAAEQIQIWWEIKETEKKTRTKNLGSRFIGIAAISFTNNQQQGARIGNVRTFREKREREREVFLVFMFQN